MAYDELLANKVRKLLYATGNIKVNEQPMFGGLAFLVNGKMCINVSGPNLMCRYDKAMQDQISQTPGFEPMMMKGKKMIGYCKVTEEGLRTKKDLMFWIDLCLDYNSFALSSKKKK